MGDGRGSLLFKPKPSMPKAQGFIPSIKNNSQNKKNVFNVAFNACKVKIILEAQMYSQLLRELKVKTK